MNIKLLFFLPMAFGIYSELLAENELKLSLTSPYKNTDDLISEDGLEKFDSLMWVGSIGRQLKIDSLKEILLTAEEKKKVDVLLDLARMYSYGNERQKYIQQANELSEDLNYKRGKAACEYEIGLSFNKLRLFPQARQSFVRSLELWKEVDDQSQEAILKSLVSMTSYHIDSEQYRDLINQYMEEALSICNSIDDSSAIFKVGMQNTYLLWNKGERSKAETVLMKNMNYAQSTEDWFISIEELLMMYDASPLNNNDSTAEQYNLLLLNISLKSGDTIKIAKSLVSVGDGQRVYPNAPSPGTKRSLIPIYIKALAIASNISHSHYGRFQMWMSLSLYSLYFDLNQSFLALNQLEIAEGIARNYKPNLLSKVYEKYAEFYEYFNAENDSLVYTYKYLALKHSESVDISTRAFNYSGLGDYFLNKENYDLSLKYYDSALFLMENKNPVSLRESIRIKLGWLYHKMGQSKKGLFLIEKASKLAKQSSISSSYMHAYLGLIYSDLGHPKEAVRHFSMSDIDSDFLGKRIYLDILKSQAKSYAVLDDFENAYLVQQTLTEKIDLMRGDSIVQKIWWSDLNSKIESQENEKQILAKDRELFKKAEEVQSKQNVLLLVLLIFSGLVILLVIVIYRIRIRNTNRLLDKSKEVDRLKSRFFSNISHELRTPLTLIAGPIRDVINIDTAKSNESLELALDNCQKLQEFVDQILDLSKIDAAKMELSPVPCQLVPFLQRLTDGFNSHALSMDISLQLTHTLDEGKWFLIDKAKLERIINNLLSNAIKYTQSRGEIQMIVTHSLMSERLQISVKDNGRGIHQKDLAHVFKRYYQARHGTTQLEGGTGIGLNLSHEIAKLFGGKLTAESKLGEGSIFTLYMPAIETKPELDYSQTEEVLEKETHESIEKDLQLEPLNLDGSKKILIVEDNVDMRRYIESILSPYFVLLTAFNGKKALELLQQENVDLIISDVMMPEMDGFELLSKLKCSEATASIPMVMLTALADMEGRLKALATGVDDYMTKPFDTRELLARVRNLLQFAHLRKEISTEDIVNQAVSEEDAPKASDIPQWGNIWLNKVEDQVLNKLNESGYTIAHLAHDIGIGERQFHRKIKELTGLTPNLYIREIRLREARRMLEVGEVESVAQACYSVGFDHTQYFSTIFQKRYGKTPSSYLRKRNYG